MSTGEESSGEPNEVTLMHDPYLDDDVEALKRGTLLPKISKDLLYSSGGCLSSMLDRRIKTIDKKIKPPVEQRTLLLLDPRFVAKYRGKYDSLHIASVQVRIVIGQFIGIWKDRGKTGILSIRDARNNGGLSSDPTLALIRPKFFEGQWIYFHCFPNLTVPLADPEVLSSVELFVELNEPFDEGNHPITIYYKVRCKLLPKCSTPGPVLGSCKGSTEFFQHIGGCIVRRSHEWAIDPQGK